MINLKTVNLEKMADEAFDKALTELIYQVLDERVKWSERTAFARLVDEKVTKLIKEDEEITKIIKTRIIEALGVKK